MRRRSLLGRRHSAVASSIYLAYLTIHWISMMSFLALPVKSWLRPGIARSSLREHRYRLFTSELLASKKWKVGDIVSVPKERGSPDVIEGVVQDARGSGWYDICLQEDQRIIKCRGSQMQARLQPSNNSTFRELDLAPLDLLNASEVVKPFLASPLNGTAPPPPHIIDLDTAIADLSGDPVKREHDRAYLDHVSHHMSTSKWVVFTDLHCAPSTLNTTLKVLDHIHSLAVEREAGVLFLGDFWHHRGTIRVDCLNAVLDALKTWTVPMVMIPGNHDQITLGGHEHGLTPLANAYRVPASGRGKGREQITTSYPGPLIFSHPTKFLEALFVPHIRDNAIMESVLQSTHADNAQVLFVHADVCGGYMNDLIVSSGGARPSMFPSDKPIFSGHFHKPHVVECKMKNVRIEYLGSPYQVSLSEAQQDKSVVVLDSSDGWNCVERIPLSIGRKHFRVEGVDEFLEIRPHEKATTHLHLAARPNDRVVVNLEKEAMNCLRRSTDAGTKDIVTNHAEWLRESGIIVEIKERADNTLRYSGEENDGESSWEDLSPESTWKAYLDDQVSRGLLSTDTANEMTVEGRKLLLEVENEEETNRAKVNLQLDEVTVSGFGPFRSEITYPLKERGLVLLRGTNRDGGSDSNGSGKTSLAVSVLWALTGTIDSRPLEDTKVSDIINESSKAAHVTVTGVVNGWEFKVSRSKTSRSGALIFMCDGRDLTTQSVKETQGVINEKLGMSPQILSRTLFHGQHALHGLLEASDTKFKEELSLVVPLTIWQNAISKARKTARAAAKRVSELEGMISLRASDLAEATLHLKDEILNLEQSQSTYDAIDSSLQNELCQDVSSASHFTDNLQHREDKVSSLEQELSLLEKERSQNVGTIESTLDDLESRLTSIEAEIRVVDRQRELCAIEVLGVRDTIKKLEEMWGLTDLETTTPFHFDLPTACPTCRQSLHNFEEGDVLQDRIRDQASTASERFQDLSRDLASIVNQLRLVQEERADLQSKIADKQTEFVRQKLLWDEKVEKKSLELSAAVQDQRQQLKDAATIFERDTSINKLQVQREKARLQVDQLHRAVNLAKEQVQKYEDAIQALRTERDTESNVLAQQTALVDAMGYRGVQTFVLQYAVKLLNVFTNSFLEQLSDGCQRLEVTLESGDKIVRKAYVVSELGKFMERPVASLSGGQYRRCSLSLAFGFAQLVAQQGGFSSSLCILDEPLMHLDRTGRSDVGRLLKNMLARSGSDEATHSNKHGLSFSTILLILQDLAAEELEESFDSVDEVVKRSGVSHVVVDEPHHTDSPLSAIS